MNDTRAPSNCFSDSHRPSPQLTYIGRACPTNLSRKPPRQSKSHHPSDGLAGWRQGRNYMQDIKGADSRCNITRKEKQSRTRTCALCRLMHMYFVIPNRLTTARYVVYQPSLPMSNSPYSSLFFHDRYPSRGFLSCIPFSPFEAH